MEKGIIVGVNITDSQKLFLDEVEELQNLCFACNIEVLDTVTQNKEAFDKRTYVGKGKIEEIKLAIQSLDIDCVIFNDELSPSQIVTLENLLEITIYDRTFIILEIFKRRAKTKEALLQVEIASLNYLLPRLTGLRKGLSRQRGAGGGFAHGRGSGEKKLDLDKRLTTDKIVFLKNELAELTKLRKQQRVKREKSDVRVVSLVGYTNSGKSSTINAILKHSTVSIENKEVLEKDMLFATLETSTRSIVTKNNAHFLLTDTVGFVSKLPHHLIESFKSTLEEIKESDLIVHVVDSNNPNFLNQIETTNSVLKDLGVTNIPTIYAFNKIDLNDSYFFIPQKFYPSITISAKNDINIDRLIDIITDNLFKDYTLNTLYIPYNDLKVLEIIKNNSIDFSINYDDNGAVFQGRINNKIDNIVLKYKKAL